MGNTTCHVKDFTKDEIHEQYPCIPDDLTDAQKSDIMAQKVCAPEDLTDAQKSDIKKTCTFSDLSTVDQLLADVGDDTRLVTPTSKSMWKLDPSDNIHKRTNTDGVWSNWTKVAGSLSHIYVDAENNLWGLKNNKVYMCGKKVDECNGEWQSMASGFARLYMADDAIWGIKADDQMYKCTNPCNGNFVNQTENLPDLRAFY